MQFRYWLPCPAVTGIICLQTPVKMAHGGKKVGMYRQLEADPVKMLYMLRMKLKRTERENANRDESPESRMLPHSHEVIDPP